MAHVDTTVTVSNCIDQRIIPQSLYLFVYKAMRTRELTLVTLSAFSHYIFEHTQVIWTERCSQQINFEITHNINLKTKIENTSATGYAISRPNNNTIHSSIGSMVKYGSNWSNFWCRSGQALSHYIRYWKVIFLA